MPPLMHRAWVRGGAALVVCVCAGLAGWWFVSGGTRPSAAPASTPGMTCDMGISAAKAGGGIAAGTAQPVVTNTRMVQPANDTPGTTVQPPPGSAPEGMVWIPGGDFWMGAEEFPDAQPWHRVSVHGFWMDKTEVTNNQFAQFVKATKYMTLAEQAPRAEDFPGALPENLVAGSVVFSPPDHAVKLNDHFQWWSYVKDANWRQPEGPKSTITDRGNYPVVHIAYEDVQAYAKWAGKRVPTEAEFEFAQRGGLERKPYAWGDELNPGGQFMANTFQGHFPNKNTNEDGHAAAAPVGSFPPNGYGLYDMAGNVWEWTSDWYRHDYYQALASQGPLARNPHGPEESFDPSEPGVKKKVHKGGSFLCTDQYCARYIAGGRGKGEPDTGTNHVGFRLVRDAR
ncbi:formylglycine-generating enzyme family protein [Nitrospira lenta]|uniref:Sulfatase-modifying factor 1 n=1 Tax=Nitrospira lenta TaxID=1436998 RepID=A0A330LCZ9_9BACT|nr:formylglycine-generating enzyme family protein [Nitrospira lenta]SPP66876.1 Sulfatase-modifying factor 1 [Nitrospira lenta]